MASAHGRRKEPRRVRQALLDCAASIAAADGLAAITVAAVAEAAGVTKGALFHHFASRQALVEAMFDMLLSKLDSAFDEAIAADPAAAGGFTRAYVRLAMTMDESTRMLWSALIGGLVGQTALAARWQAWLRSRLDRHAGTDGGVGLEAVRMAADGAWISLLGNAGPEGVIRLRNYLLHLTQP